MDELSKKFLIGLVLTMAIIVILPIYAIRETKRHTSAAERFTEAAVERGAITFATTCSGCHGIQGGGKVESPSFIGFPLNPEFREKAGLVIKLPGGDSYVIDEDVARKVIHRGRIGGDPTNSLSPEEKKLTLPNLNMPAWGLDDGGPIKDFAIEDLIALLQHWNQGAMDEALSHLPAAQLDGLKAQAAAGQNR
ncbi:MAG: hypothetical protein EXR59_01110 [Dehalococcoidia bacterium]|nr:hypothetical protein [Dehalococcoidia bacterium]